MPKIVVSNLCKSYDGTFALDGLSFVLEDGDFVNVMGESGCGKTTLLKCIAGIERATCGEIYFGEEIVNNTEARQRHVAYVSQEFSLFPNMTVFENVLFALKKVKMSYDEKCDTVWKILEKTGLAAIQNAFPKELSYGQRQKTAIARALVKNPSIVLFDEPLSNIDALSKAEYKSLILQTKKAFPQSVYLYVTHNAADALALGNKTLVMSRGKVLQYGRTEDVFSYPCCKEVSQICWENTRSATAAVCNGELITGDGLKIPLSPYMQATLSAEEGSEVDFVSCGTRRAVFDKQGDSVCGFASTLSVPCMLTDKSFVVARTEYGLGELKYGLTETGDGYAVVFVDALTPFCSCKKQTLADAVAVRTSVVFVDDNFVVCECFGQKISIRIDKFAASDGKVEFKNNVLELSFKTTDMKFFTKKGNVAVADYRVYPNVALAKVINRNNGIVSVGGVKLTLPFDVPKDKNIKLLFAKDAFCQTSEKKFLKVRQLLNIQKGVDNAIVFADVYGFDRYITAVVPLPFRCDNDLYFAVDATKILLANDGEAD